MLLFRRYRRSRMAVRLVLRSGGLGIEREEFERWSGGTLLASLPLADGVLRNIQMVGKDGLTNLFTLTQGPDLSRREIVNRRKTRFVELSHCLLVDNARFKQASCRFMN